MAAISGLGKVSEGKVGVFLFDGKRCIILYCGLFSHISLLVIANAFVHDYIYILRHHLASEQFRAEISTRLFLGQQPRLRQPPWQAVR